MSGKLIVLIVNKKKITQDLAFCIGKAIFSRSPFAIYFAQKMKLSVKDFLINVNKSAADYLFAQI